MPFFRKRKCPEAKGYKRKTESTRQLALQDDEITSSEDDNETYFEPSEDETETAHEKKLRLAKQYLGKIEDEECERLRDKNLDCAMLHDTVSERLKLDNLKAAGKLKLRVAEQYQGADVDNAKILKCKEHRHSVTCICLSSDDQCAFSGSKDGSIVKWQLLKGVKVASVPFSKLNLMQAYHKQIMSMAISFDDKYLAVGDVSGIIQIWNPTDLKHIGTLQGHRDAVNGLRFRYGTHTLYTCSKDRSVKVWSVDELSYVETLYGHLDGITAIDALSRERAITAGGRDASLRLWKIVEESHLVYNNISSANVDTVRLINDEYFVSGADDGYVCVWSTAKKKPLCAIKEAHGCDAGNASEPFGITALASLQNTDLIATGSSDGLIRVWKAGDKFRTMTPVFTIALEGFVNDLMFSSDGKYLVAGVGREHRFGRWTVIKTAVNSVVVIPLKMSSG